MVSTTTSCNGVFCLALALFDDLSIFEFHRVQHTCDYTVIFLPLDGMPFINTTPDPQDAGFRSEHTNAQSITALEDQKPADVGRFLIVSPYTSQQHLLDLGALEEPQRLLARALTVLEPVRIGYATAPYRESFNWISVISLLRTLNEEAHHSWKHQHFYIVVFRSRVSLTTNRAELGELDERAHAEATRSGGLLKYWFGEPDDDGRNLATCK